MISKGPHLRDQPAEQRTSLTNELLNISPSLSCLLLHLLQFFQSFIHSFLFSFCLHSFILFQTIFVLSFALSLVFPLTSRLLKIVPKTYSCESLFSFSLCSIAHFFVFSCFLSCVFFRPTETVWADFFSSLHRYSTAASCSNKFTRLHIRHRASYTHAAQRLRHLRCVRL